MFGLGSPSVRIIIYPLFTRISNPSLNVSWLLRSLLLVF